LRETFSQTIRENKNNPATYKEEGKLEIFEDEN